MNDGRALRAYCVESLVVPYGTMRAGKEEVRFSHRHCHVSPQNIPSIIVRPGRLVGGTFTNYRYDVPNSLQIQGGAEDGVQLAAGNSLLGDCKRDA